MTLLTSIYLGLTVLMVISTLYHLVYHKYHCHIRKLISDLDNSVNDEKLAREIRLTLTTDFYGGSSLMVVFIALVEFIWLALCFWAVGWITLGLLFLNYLVSTSENKKPSEYWGSLFIKIMYLTIYGLFGFYHFYLVML